MKITSLRIGDWVRIKLPSPQGERLSIPMQVVGLLSCFNNPSPNDTVYLDFSGNEGDVWEEEVQNLVKIEGYKMKNKIIAGVIGVTSPFIVIFMLYAINRFFLFKIVLIIAIMILMSVVSYKLIKLILDEHSEKHKQ